MKKIFLICCLILLVGCAGAKKKKKVWYHPAKTQTEFEIDRIECRDKALQDVPRFPKTTHEMMRFTILFSDCMKLKGYYLKEKE